jgi:nicotinamide-nucleotide amidase
MSTAQPNRHHDLTDARPNPVPSLADVTALAARLGKKMIAADLTCATAESCTGGLIGHILTENTGSSAYFAGGAIVYSYAAKKAILGVQHATLLAVGAVSPEVAQQMAEGALRAYAVDVAVSVTGIAGPGGALPGKPTGTVYLHLAAADGYARGAHYIWLADRSGNKLLSAQAALHMMSDYVDARG